ncbi:MAG TPA: beta-ketoacyl-[acyl-carrier-protein] synthase family protein [Planctomycetota bacterium]|jgi:3-oxoacyl-[acyl-carrier-protein] synthase II
MSQRRVAITGFGVVSPIGNGRDSFWRSLRHGDSGIAAITRFDCSTFAVQLAGEVKARLDLPPDVGLIASHDPKIGFGYAACVEALMHAHIQSFDEQTLLHLGASLEIFDLRKAVHGGKPDFTALAERSFQPGAQPLQIPLDTTARLICQAFGRPIRSLTNCSACAASAQAIGSSFQSIRTGRVRTAVCGGFDSMINPLGIGGFQLLGALTTENHHGAHACRPFDAERNGTVLGEGAAVLVLEEMEYARSQGKTILAEVCGYGSTLDAHNLSAPDPDGDGALRAMRMALQDAAIPPTAIWHISAHGTGTRLNDEVEAAAIRRVFERWQTIPVSATKSMTGHLIAAAGSVQAGACLLPLLENVLPPNPSLRKVGSGCELCHVQQPETSFTGEYVLSNSFGFGGQNASLVLRRAHG